MEKLSVPHQRELEEIYGEYCQHLPKDDQDILRKYFHSVLKSYHQLKGTLFGISESYENILLKIIREKCEGMNERRIKKIYSILNKAFRFIEPKLFERVKGYKIGSMRDDILVPGSRCHYKKEFLLERISQRPVDNHIRTTVYDLLSASKVINPINLEGMERMSIIELVPGKIYNNKVIYATVLDKGFNMTAYHTIIEDETGQCAKLCIYNISPHLEQQLFSGVKIAIASPYYKSVGGDGCNYIRIDTPEEVIILPGIVYQINSNNSNEVHKLKGNEFFKSKKYFEAISCYTQAIHGDPCNPFYRSNRALCYLKTEYFEEALFDAEKAVELDPSELKFRYRLAMAWSGLENHEKSVEILEILPKDDPDVKTALELERTLLANTRGEIDLEDLARRAKEGENLKIGDYIGPITIEISPKHGHGVFATQDIQKGEVIIVMKAVAFVAKATTEELKVLQETTPYGPSCKMNNALLIQRLIEHIIKSKLTAFRVFNLFNKNRHHESIPIEYYRSQGYELIRDKQKPPYQMDQIRSIVLKSTFSYSHNEVFEDDYVMPSGIWPIQPHINHACIGNVWPKCYRDLLIIRACTLIPKGAELTTSFFDTYACVSLNDRLTKLSLNWEYKCSCDMCELESDPKYKNAVSRAILLCHRVKKQFPDVFSMCVLQHNHYKLLYQALNLAEELKLGPTRFNSAIWQVIITLTRQKVSPKDQKKFFSIINRAKQFICEKDIKHQWFFWMNCMSYTGDDEFKYFAERMFHEVESYLIDIP